MRTYVNRTFSNNCHCAVWYKKDLMSIYCRGKILLVFKTVVILILCCATSYFIQAQGSYGTLNGVLSVSGEVDKQYVTAHSKSLEVRLDYDLAIFEMRLPINSLHTGVDSIDHKLMQRTEEYLALNGELGIEFINTQTHPPMHFDFKAILKHLDKNVTIIGEGHLEHIEEGQKFVCLLGLSFEFDPKELELKSLGANNLRVQVRQTILNRIGEDH